MTEKGGEHPASPKVWAIPFSTKGGKEAATPGKSAQNGKGPGGVLGASPSRKKKFPQVKKGLCPGIGKKKETVRRSVLRSTAKHRKEVLVGKRKKNEEKKGDEKKVNPDGEKHLQY